jgi:predicted nucleic acid-binding protein
MRVVRDPNDDAILATAIAARADYLVSRDKDLLSLGEYDGIKIVSPEAFLQVLRT